jgi:hypothetical protein
MVTYVIEVLNGKPYVTFRSLLVVSTVDTAFKKNSVCELVNLFLNYCLLLELVTRMAYHENDVLPINISKLLNWQLAVSKNTFTTEFID